MFSDNATAMIVCVVTSVVGCDPGDRQCKCTYENPSVDDDIINGADGVGRVGGGYGQSS